MKSFCLLLLVLFSNVSLLMGQTTARYIDPKRSISISESATSYSLATIRSYVPDIANIGRLHRKSGATAVDISIDKIPNSHAAYEGRLVGRLASGEVAHLSIQPKLQGAAERLVAKSSSPYVALVAIEPQTGRILAMAGRPDRAALHSGFKAASLFKIITAAAAIEEVGIAPDKLIRYRGGTYALEKWNYLPDPKKDKQVMSMREALGRSCNAVFGRIFYSYLSPEILNSYLYKFGFNRDIPFEMPLPYSAADIGDTTYEHVRSAAGFGNVRLSPVHAAMIAAAIGNDGVMMSPSIVDFVTMPSGEKAFAKPSRVLGHVLKESTATKLRKAMVSTTTTGTSKREFYKKGKATLPGLTVAGKTGTLRGDNPAGMTRLFIATAEGGRFSDPAIAIATIVVDPGRPHYTPSKLAVEFLKTWQTL